MYSTHTSSSYSPSISDGTLTPNSQQPHPQAQGDDGGAEESKANGDTAKGEDERDREPASKAKRPAHALHHHHHHHYHHQQALKIANKLRKINKEAKLAQGGTAAAAAAAAGAGAGTGIAGAASKFDKLTAEGIKSRGDGSYQCQFCDKSFPRLGYLKHHVQVSVLRGCVWAVGLLPGCLV